MSDIKKTLEKALDVLKYTKAKEEHFDVDLCSHFVDESILDIQRALNGLVDHEKIVIKQFEVLNPNTGGKKWIEKFEVCVQLDSYVDALALKKMIEQLRPEPKAQIHVKVEEK